MLLLLAPPRSGIYPPGVAGFVSGCLWAVTASSILFMGCMNRKAHTPAIRSHMCVHIT